MKSIEGYFEDKLLEDVKAKRMYDQFHDDLWEDEFQGRWNKAPDERHKEAVKMVWWYESHSRWQKWVEARGDRTAPKVVESRRWYVFFFVLSFALWSYFGPLPPPLLPSQDCLFFSPL